MFLVKFEAFSLNMKVLLLMAVTEFVPESIFSKDLGLPVSGP